MLEAMQVEHDDLPGQVQALEEYMAEKAKAIEDSQKYASKSISNEQVREMLALSASVERGESNGVVLVVATDWPRLDLSPHTILWRVARAAD